MAAGDVALTVTGAVLSVDNVVKSGNLAIQTSKFVPVTTTVTSAPNGSDLQSAEIILAKNTGPGSTETVFDSSKTYKITVTEV